MVEFSVTGAMMCEVVTLFCLAFEVEVTFSEVRHLEDPRSGLRCNRMLLVTLLFSLFDVNFYNSTSYSSPRFLWDLLT